MITGGDEVCILPPPTLSEKGVGIPTFFVHFPKIRVHLCVIWTSVSFSRVFLYLLFAAYDPTQTFWHLFTLTGGCSEDLGAF